MRAKLKKILASGLAFALTASLFSGCGFNSADSAETSDTAAADDSTDSSDDNKLNVLIWDSTYPDAVFEGFEKETGIKVNCSYITDTNEELTKLMNSDEYDYCDIESAYVKTFEDAGILSEINYDNIPNISNVNEDYIGAPGDEEDKYATTASGGFYTYIVYNKETCPIEITSFKDLADPALKGQVCLIDSSISLYGMALTALGYPADSTDESQISEANDLLTEIKPNVVAFTGASSLSQLENGDCSVALCWDYPSLMLDKNNWDKYAVADISTGYECSQGFMGIPKSAKRKANAEKFINYYYSPEVQATICKDEAYGGNPPLLKKDVMEGYLDDSYYDTPLIEANDKFKDSAWKISITDDQLSLIDTYYTRLKSE